MPDKNLPAVAQTANISTQNATAFSGPVGFESAQRMALALVTSTMVPQAYQGKDNMGNALIALEMAQRVGASPMAVMQNLHIIHGRPSWSSSFIIAALNSCGRFSPLRFRVDGDGDKKTCVAWTYDRDGGEILEGPPASIEMAKAEGWFQKSGSKWKTMPDLMLRYRAAAFFGRLYAPDILMGMHSDDEVQDMGERQAVEAVELVEPQVVGAEKTAEKQKPEKTPGEALAAARAEKNKAKRGGKKKPEPAQAPPADEPPPLAEPVGAVPVDEPAHEQHAAEPQAAEPSAMDGDLF